MKPSLPILLALLCGVLPTSAQIPVNWTGAVDQQWFNFSNWSPSSIPDNSGTTTYDAILGSGAGLVFVNNSPTIESLTMQSGVALSVSNGFSFTVRDDVLNDGEIRLEGATSFSTFSISDSGGDQRVRLDGTGEIRLDSGNDRVTGTTGNTLANGGGHGIRGHGVVGLNAILIENAGFIVADSPGNALVVDPRTTFDNTGFLWAVQGGVLDLRGAAYTNTGLGEMLVGDGSEIRLTSATVTGGMVKVLQQNGNADDNRLVVAGSSTVVDLTNEAALFVDEGQTLTVNGSAFTNNGRVHLLSATNSSTILFSGSTGSAITLGGTGTILLDDGNDRVSGAAGHVLTVESPQSIEGGGKIGENVLSFVNRGMISAANPAVPLEIDPRATWVNVGGVLRAVGGATAELNSATYSSTGGGQFLLGEDSTFELRGVLFEDSRFSIDNQDGDPLDHLVQVLQSSSFDAVESDAVIRVDNGQTLAVLEDLFVNNSELHLDGGSNATSLSIDGGADDAFELGGGGTLFLNAANDQITGLAGDTLHHAASHRIEGGGSLGNNLISFVNHGLIEANLPGEPLVVDPRVDFVNDGGTLRAAPGSTADLRAAAYTAPNAGRFLLGDGSTFLLRGGTWSDCTLGVEDLDSDPANHFVRILLTTNFERMTSETSLTVENGQTLNLEGSFTNGRLVELDSTLNATRLNFSDPSDQIVELTGTGTVRLDSANDQVLGSASHTLVQESDHLITGFGAVGNNVINLVNRGTIVSDTVGEWLVIDPQVSFVNEGGMLRAEPGAGLTLLGGTYTAPGGGRHVIADDAEVTLQSVTLEDMALEIPDLDTDFSNNHATLVNSSTFIRATNELALGVNNGQSLTLQGGSFTNLGTVDLDSTTNITSVSINGTGFGDSVSLLGDGELRLDSENDRVIGISNHTLIHGPDHTISGFGRIGSNTIDVRNRGLIRSAVTGQTLTLDPRTIFANEGGVLEASEGAVIRFDRGTYTSGSGGVYAAGEDALFEMFGATFEDLTLAAANTTGSGENHFGTVVNSTTFRSVTNELAINVENGQTLTLADGVFTNEGSIRPDAATNATRVSIDGTGFGNEVRIEGGGMILLDHPSDQVSGIANHLLVQGAGHRIEGAGAFGANLLRVRNEGTVTANLSGEALVVDVRDGLFDNRGTLQATSGGLLEFRDAVSDAGGTILAEGGSAIVVSGPVTQDTGSTTVNGTLTASSVTVDKSVLQGGGLVEAPLAATFSTVSPGTSTGTLTIDGNTTLGPGTSLGIEINATADHDVLAVTGGTLMLTGATLRLDYLGGPADVGPGDTLTIVTSGGMISGEFLNITDGERLYSVNGLASFVVNYGPSAITLTDFIYDPAGPPNEPPVFTTTVPSVSIDENTPPGTVLATFAAYDPEGVAIAFSLDDGSVPFVIDPLNGEIRVDGALDFEARPSYALMVGASDGQNLSEEPITISLNNLLETNADLVETLLSDPDGAFPGESDPAIIGFGADPDGDGHLNVFELWRGTDPSVFDQPEPVLLEPYFVVNGDRGSAVVTVDAAVDDLLFMEAEFSFDLATWRTATANRVVVSEAGGVRILRFYDTVALPGARLFFVRFFAEPDREP